MGKKTEENDGQTVAENVIENILNEVNRSISERTDCCFDSFESLKLQTFGSEDILDYGCSRRESCGKAKEYECQDSGTENNPGYQSLANLPEVCVYSSSMSKTSKQGEGDFQHPTIREAVAFYRLERGEEEPRPGGSKDCYGASVLTGYLNKDTDKIDADTLTYSLEPEQEGDVVSESHGCKNSCASSLTTEDSHDALIEDLQKSINSVSYDDVHLTDFDDGSDAPHRSAGSNTPFNFNSKDTEGCVCLCESQDSDVCSEQQACLQQSKKFCQINNVHFFPHGEIPSNYCQLVNESYDKYDLIMKEEDEEILLSDGSSEEMVIIESDEIDQITADSCYSQANNFKNPFLCPVAPSTTLLSQLPSCSTAGTSYKLAEPSCSNGNRITVVADVEPLPVDHRNWEEALEVQMNVTEPLKLTELEDNESCDFVKTRKYWTSIGLVTEKNVNPKYTAFMSDDADGIESVPGMSRVQEILLARGTRNEDEILKVDEALERDANEKSYRNFGEFGTMKFEKSNRRDHEKLCTLNNCYELKQSGGKLTDANKVNYLNFSDEAASKGNKKNKFVARLTRSLTNLFRSKKKNPK